MKVLSYCAGAATALLIGALIPSVADRAADFWAVLTEPTSHHWSGIEIAGLCVLAVIVARIGGRS